MTSVVWYVENARARVREQADNDWEISMRQNVRQYQYRKGLWIIEDYSRGKEVYGGGVEGEASSSVHGRDIIHEKRRLVQTMKRFVRTAEIKIRTLQSIKRFRWERNIRELIGNGEVEQAILNADGHPGGLEYTAHHSLLWSVQGNGNRRMIELPDGRKFPALMGITSLFRPI